GKYLKRNPNLSFVALDGDKIIGAILVGNDGRRGYVQHLDVDSTFRGKGVGEKIISSAEEDLSKVGIDKTHLFVANDNI
ncbi:GNAT family N-acetyltransferase, partial [Vibrio parahaemolyticus]|uniref:GNAT family N-acetyltransferase n=1 Tax=Vibrio parahaemolyticus TaxID=670 RepID=UPI00211315B3